MQWRQNFSLNQSLYISNGEMIVTLLAMPGFFMSNLGQLLE